MLRFANRMRLATLVLLMAGASAQAQVPIILPRVDGPVELDGPSFESAWDSVEPWIPVQYEPDNGADATERTEFLVAYDEHFVYFALRAYDSDPNGLRANTLYRDRLSGDDHFEILLDTFNDGETALLFTTTPNGIRKDAAISNDASGGGLATGGWINGSFNTYWDVATRITPEGWFAEIRVPISSLRFQDTGDAVAMGITLQRKIARKTERVVFPAVPSIANWAFLKPSLAQEIVLEGLQSTRPVYVTGYGLGGMEEDRAWIRSGLDLKYGIANGATLDLTANTDFAQVEADDEQVNLTRFSLFYPEKRQFFQERAGLFDFRVGSQSRLFHSRRIGLNAAGQPVPIWGGGRVVARRGNWDVGILDILTRDSEALPAENFAVVRARRQLPDPQSRLGGMLTSRTGADGSYNVAYGLDGIIHTGGEDFLIYQVSQSFDGRVASDNVLNHARLALAAERRRRRAWGYNSIMEWAGPDYDPGVGFTERSNYLMADHSTSYTWIGSESSSLIWHQASVRGLVIVDPGFALESAALGPQWEYSAKSGSGGRAQLQWNYERLGSAFSLSDAIHIPPGEYGFVSADAEYHTSHTQLLQVRPSVMGGGFYDGWQIGAGARPVWYVSKHLELEGTYRFTRIRFPARNEQFVAHLGRLRVGTALNAKLSANAFLQLNTALDLFTGNIRIRYNFREGNDLWLVYNVTQYMEPHSSVPTEDGHTLLVKYTHTLIY